jgi:hypothetical protein
MTAYAAALDAALAHVTEFEDEIEYASTALITYGFAGDYGPSLKKLLEGEGGYTNDPSDPGGPTNFGITIFDYRKYVDSDAPRTTFGACP